MKKKYIAGLVALLLIIGILVLGSSDDKETPEASTTITEDTTEVAQEEIKESDTDSDIEMSKTEESQTSQLSMDYIGVGDIIRDDNVNVIMTVEDIGIYSQDDWSILYVTVDASNNGDQEVLIGQETAVYVDDYQINAGYDESNSAASAILHGITINDTPLIPDSRTINAGRKMKYMLYAIVVDSMNEGTKVEFELFNQTVLFKNNGEWLYGDNQVSSETGEGGIGNPRIDANPDRYIPEGITGEIDVIDGTFYSNKPVSGIIPGEYLIVGGENAVIMIDGNKMSLRFLGSEVDFEDADMEEVINSSDGCSYYVYGNGQGYVVSFYEGGLYLYTGKPDTEDDYAEGFYEKL